MSSVQSWRMIMSISEAREAIGKPARWRRRSSSLYSYGTIVGVKGKNVETESDWLWFPDVELEVCDG